jgi:virginiamycin A acetyltransferase
MNYKVVASTVGDGFKAYDRAEVINSSLGNKVSVGNDTIVQDSKLAGYNSINRRNYILRSSLGHYTYTGIGAMIRSSDIGKFNSISWNVSIGGGDHSHGFLSTLPESRFYQLDDGGRGDRSENALAKIFQRQARCTVGHDVLISSNVTILRDVSVGHGAVIGAGAVVTKNVEPYSIVAGVPARVIRFRFKENIIEELLRIAWWNWPIEFIRQNSDCIFGSELDISHIRELAVKNNLYNE